MEKGALFVGWGAIITGREKAAPRVLQEAMVYLEHLRTQGVVDSVEVVVLEPHGGELDGFVLIKGNKEPLAKLRVDDELVKVIVGVQLVHANVRVVWGYCGAEMAGVFRIWDEQEAKLL